MAGYLANALHGAGHNIDWIYSRTEKNARKLAEKVNARWTSNVENIESDSGIWIFALTDQATLDIINKIAFRQCLLLHTAGSLPLNIFSGHSDDYGVLYPLQTISASRNSVLSDIPFCVESNNAEGLQRIRALAGSISSLVYDVSSEKRLFLHLAAVFACNFTNHMYALAEEIAINAGIQFQIFHSLIRETCEKTIDTGPVRSQTGPAVRNDHIIIKKHLDLLSFSPRLREIYCQLTESIQVRTEVKPDDELVLKDKLMINFKEYLGKVKAFAFDVDGVFSDSTLLLGSGGELIRSMNIKDGYAMQHAVRKGYPIAIITGGNSESVKDRFNILGVHDVYLKSSRKLDDFEHFCNKYNIDSENVLYMGDDIPDYPVMKKVGFPTCPCDAVPEIKQIAKYVSGLKGGDGCVRDVIEQVMRVHGKWMDADSFILQT